MTGPPMNSASVNCQPSSSHRITPSSSTRFVDPISNAIAAVKSAPLRNSDRASATAAYEHDDEAAPSSEATASVRGRSSPSSRTMVALRTTAWMIAERVNPRISAQVISHVIEPVIFNACAIPPMASSPPSGYPIPVAGIGHTGGTMAVRTGRRHVMLLFTVLAGLFLMHGVSCRCTVCRCRHARCRWCDRPVSPHIGHVGPVARATTVSGALPTADHMDGCETCVPLRPEGMAGLFLALFLIVITLWRPRLPHAPRLIHPYWPHGPPRTGVQTLRTLSISRT